MTATKFVRHIYKADGREMLALNPQESMSLNIALTYEEISAIRQAQKDQRDA
jgi:hypothetical protein